MIGVFSPSAAATAALAGALAELAVAGDVVVLAGEMGAGKTTFAQGFGAGLGVDEPITSPTFALLHRYHGGRLAMYHADVYRLDTLGELADLGLGELDDGVLLVEWGDVVARALGDHLAVHLAHQHGNDPDRDPGSDDTRTLTFSAHGPAWAVRWSRVAEVLGGAGHGTQVTC